MKKAVIICLSALFLCGMIGFSAADYVSAAEDGGNESIVFEMLEGASIRKEEPSGIRFTTHVTQAFIDDLQEKNPGGTIEFGTEIVPVDIADAEPLQIEQTKIDESSTETDIYYNAVLTKIPEEYYNFNVKATAYYTVTSAGGEEQTVYAENPQTRSIAYVASGLLSLGQDEQILKDIVDKVVSSISAGEDFSLEEGYTKKIEVAGNEGLVVQYVSSAEDVVAVDENGTVTAKSAGKATVTAKIGDISDEVEITVTPRAAAGANEIEALDSPLSAGNIVSGNADSWEIGFSEDGIGGEQKVVKIAATSAGELTSFYVKPRIDLSAFGADSYISFYMYIDADTLTSGETFKQIQVGYSGGNAFAVPAEEWVRVTQPLSDFTESEEFPGYYGLLKLHNGGEFGAADNKMEFYLRDIAICERTDVNTEAGEIAALTDGSLNDIAMFRGTDNEKTAASVKYISDEVTGDSGAVYIESLVLEGYPAIYVRPRTGSDWEGAKGVAFDIYVDAATINGNAVRWIENAEGSRYLPVKAGVWTTLSVPIEKFIAHASDDETSGTSGFYTLGFFGNDGIGDRPSNANFAFYIRNVRAVSGKTVSENALTAFDELSVYDDIYFADNNCFAASYDQEGIAGKQGVLRFDQIEDVGAPTFFVKTDADISSYKYVSFEIYFVGSSLSDGHTGKIILAGDTAKDPWINPYTGNSDRTPVPADQWVQLTFEVKYFIADGDTGYYLFTFMNGGGDWPKDTEATFYISDVQGLTEYPQ